MSNATLALQSVKWPVFKVFSVLFLAFLFLSHSGWWDVILDARVIQPFLLLLLPSVLVAAVKRENPIWAVIASCVPAGVAVGAINLIAPLFDMQGTEEAVASPLIYTPIALGLILAYSLRVVAPPYESESDTTSSLWFCASFLLTTICITVYVSSLPAWSLFLNRRGLLFTIAIVLCCFAFNDKARLTLGEVLARGGLFCCLLAAVYAVTLYTASAAVDDLRGVGPALAESWNLLAYGALVAVAAGACGVRPPEDRELLNRDWHLTEAYVFITLIVFPPQTLLELISKPMG
jgi:hypothetical protein